MAMRDTNFRDDNIREEDRTIAMDDRLREEIREASHEMVKATILLNSGAMVAMLGFTQALVRTVGWACYKQYALFAMCSFLVGAAFGPIAFACRAEASRRALMRDIKRATFMLSAMFFCSGASLSALVGGAVIAGVGIYRTF
jgi:hypothetical protein